MITSTKEILFAFSLSLLAGLSTGIGSVLAFYTKQQDKKFLSGVLGFSAGVMIYVSMIEIFKEAKEYLIVIYGATRGYWLTTVAFFWGVLLVAIIDKFVPDVRNSSRLRDMDELERMRADNSTLLRMGLFSAVAIAMHNFPEGIATFTSTIQDPALGISIAVAIMIHNIPEGIAVSVPVYFATGSRKKAFLYSFYSGLTEPLGAILGYFLLIRFFTNTMFGIILAGVAGIMVYLSLDELLPTAEKYGEHRIVIYGLMSGMVVIALSLLLFA